MEKSLWNTCNILLIDLPNIHCGFLDDFSGQRRKFARRKSRTKRIVFQPYFDSPSTGREGKRKDHRDSYLPRVDGTRIKRIKQAK